MSGKKHLSSQSQDYMGTFGGSGKKGDVVGVASKSITVILIVSL